MATFKPEEIRALEEGGNGVSGWIILFWNAELRCHETVPFLVFEGGPCQIFGEVDSEGCTQTCRQVMQGEASAGEVLMMARPISSHQALLPLLQECDQSP